MTSQLEGKKVFWKWRERKIFQLLQGKYSGQTTVGPTRTSLGSYKENPCHNTCISFVVYLHFLCNFYSYHYSHQAKKMSYFGERGRTRAYPFKNPGTRFALQLATRVILDRPPTLGRPLGGFRSPNWSSRELPLKSQIANIVRSYISNSRQLQRNSHSVKSLTGKKPCQSPEVRYHWLKKKAWLVAASPSPLVHAKDLEGEADWNEWGLRRERHK